jgi:hypothetical protein
MALLGFLVDGDGDPPEWRLTLAKLLCGALPQAPYGLEAPLSDAEQAEVEGLLQAVLGHADGRLGDDGTVLRQEFLQRPGLLSARPGAWVLQVERRSGDELLDGLAWSWSWIRLPWMDDLLCRWCGEERKRGQKLYRFDLTPAASRCQHSACGASPRQFTTASRPWRPRITAACRSRPGC